MRLLSAVLLVSTLTAACGGPRGAPVPDHPADPPAVAGALGDPTSETIGGITLGDSVAAVEATLGPAGEVGEAMEEGATGLWVADWSWPQQGVRLVMAAASADAPPTVHSITIAAPSTLTTSRGVGLGAPRAEVERVYAAFLGQGRQDGEPDLTSPAQLIIGSVYGGTFFDFADGQLVRIFVGAGAE